MPEVQEVQVGGEAAHPVGQGERVIREGDDVDSIAFQHGLAWETIWMDDANAELRRLRGDPQLLLPGDRLHIPDRKTGEVIGATEQHHRFRRKDVPQKLVVRILDEEEPRADEPYVLIVDGDTVAEARTDSDGTVEATIPPDAAEAVLRVGEGDELVEYDLALGALDPVESPSGAQQRLRSLGFDCGDEDCGETLNDATREALKAFQETAGLEPTGRMDDDTLRTLEREHGC
jgi:N-acetylmuramoyl-L-alanine amidase